MWYNETDRERVNSLARQALRIINDALAYSQLAMDGVYVEDAQQLATASDMVREIAQLTGGDGE